MVRQAMKQIDPGLAVDAMRTMDDQIETTLSNERMIELLAISFGLLATLLAGVGLYGVLAYSTAQRTREIGIRIALGSSRFQISRLVLMDVLRLAGIGDRCGDSLLGALGRLLRSQLFGVSAADPFTLGAVVLLIAAGRAGSGDRCLRVVPLRSIRRLHFARSNSRESADRSSKAATSKFGSPLCLDSDVTAHHAALLEILLVVLLCLPECSGGNDLGGDGLAVSAGGVEFGDLGAGLGELLVVMGEDDAAVLRAPVRTLAIDLGGIVQSEECVQKRFVGETGWSKVTSTTSAWPVRSVQTSL